MEKIFTAQQLKDRNFEVKALAAEDEGDTINLDIPRPESVMVEEVIRNTVPNGPALVPMSQSLVVCHFAFPIQFFLLYKTFQN
jgi:hypothetical protein